MHKFSSLPIHLPIQMNHTITALNITDKYEIYIYILFSFLGTIKTFYLLEISFYLLSVQKFRNEVFIQIIKLRINV